MKDFGMAVYSVAMRNWGKLMAISLATFLLLLSYGEIRDHFLSPFEKMITIDNPFPGSSLTRASIDLGEGVFQVRAVPVVTLSKEDFERMKFPDILIDFWGMKIFFWGVRDNVFYRFSYAIPRKGAALTEISLLKTSDKMIGVDLKRGERELEKACTLTIFICIMVICAVIFSWISDWLRKRKKNKG